ncbi:HD-GYP domain-containing protein [Streptomyces sp. NPDC090126]|uniref:HD-GYP domain-containing protein n=1 Tax=Streptomyces sp. NPDC090126 TaxID=3365952 RepID=UPI00382446F0
MRAPYGSRPPAPAALAVRGAALLLALVALSRTLVHGLAEPGLALVFGFLVAAGEMVRRNAAVEEREPAPLAAAGALGYALLGESAGRPTAHGALQVIAVVVVAQALAALPRMARGRRTDADRAARRTLTVGFAAVCCQPLYHSGQAERWFGDGAFFPLFPLAVLALTALGDAVLAALLAGSAARAGGAGGLPPYGSLLADEVRAQAGTGVAIGAAAAVTALGVAVAGPWTPAALCGPLLLTQVSVRRYAAVRTTCRQTMASLARSTEIAGYTPPGHARRVAALATAVGRELGLTGPRLAVLEHAALMHDIGQLSLLDPVAGGATALLPAAEQRRIALLGGAVVRRTGAGPEVAAVVERQADPYREQPLAARIVRTVNAYDDLCGESVGGPLGALEQLRLGTGHDHQPQVVEALGRVLARGGLTPAGAG